MNNHSRVSRRGSVGQLSPTRSPYLIDLHADCERILAEHFVRELQRKRAEKREFRKKRRADHRFIYREVHHIKSAKEKRADAENAARRERKNAHLQEKLARAQSQLARTNDIHELIRATQLKQQQHRLQQSEPHIPKKWRLPLSQRDGPTNFSGREYYTKYAEEREGKEKEKEKEVKKGSSFPGIRPNSTHNTTAPPFLSSQALQQHDIAFSARSNNGNANTAGHKATGNNARPRPQTTDPLAGGRPRHNGINGAHAPAPSPAPAPAPNPRTLPLGDNHGDTNSGNVPVNVPPAL